MRWDIFCKVIDNHGDIGVCWRLAAQLARAGESVRLHVDDAAALAWMAPGGEPGVEVVHWSDDDGSFAPGDVVIEAFGCELPQSFQAAMAARAVTPAWINLEYLTAERFAERNHGLPSPVFAGPAAGLTKHFFYPGFTEATGGLLRESDLIATQQSFDRDEWLGSHSIDVAPDARIVSLFCYEPVALQQLLMHLASDSQCTALLVAAGRPTAAMKVAVDLLDAREPQWNVNGRLAITFLPLLTQPNYDELLFASDLNFVRGEDSLVRALWAGKPFIWNIYPQHDDAHHAKLQAFLDWLGAPASLREFHLAWNGFSQALHRPDVDQWSACARDAREHLLAQDDLVTRLLRFVRRAS